MFGQFTREEKTDGSLDLPGGDGGPLVVVGQTGSFGGDTFKDIVDKAVHDGHGFAGDTGIRVNLLENLVDVDPVAILPFLLLLFVTLGDVLLGFAGLLSGLASSFRCHDTWVKL